MKVLQPQGWAPPLGYANGIAARGTVVFVAGQVGWDAAQKFRSEDLALQHTFQLLDLCLPLLHHAKK